MDIQEGTRRAAERARGAPVRFLAYYPILETFRGKVVWEGSVSEFEAPYLGKVYAWAVEGDDEPQFVAVLGIPPIDSPLDAVRAWLASQALH